ncbi:hypothetical protein DJ71_08845 [Halorubrum sp. E3]|uniref:Uncharacterized protein n=2 Tax=Halorubrum distributum TaxID=29283 RepID=M0NWQ0_9EURY|nr:MULTISPECIES: hypothetical protein [Halorubrum distributum group]OYR84430.1 hypothetical protein DJ71_08845 [Halorubrum sp. E3]PHQ45958.1 hypothetical protein DJ68_10030 [Halorubrum sp. C3]EMA62251.1 hypothetical protein C470_04686 [Halorubrum litoreum JCM 13561]EMA71709.1 hypothetical protein C462_05440 [Halorubrum arcis JCM 13916]MDV7348505.1 hypothetical protein [Halorubrum distributum]
MERTPDGTPVGVDDPYAVAGVCDHLTGDGRCRFALTRAGDDPEFAADRRADGYDCHVGADGEWSACPHYRSTTDAKTCARCGLDDVRLAHDDSRPLVEEHHLSYGGTEAAGHEITVGLCRWCHAKVHKSIARIDDDASPAPEAIAERERRRGAELSESAFETASERYDPEE